MDVRLILAIFALIFLVSLAFSAPVDPNKKSQDTDSESAQETENKIESEINDLGLEYGRYLQQVVEALEQDKEFAKKLENVSQDDIKNGAIARELNFVSHNVRTKLDELKRIELDRLRKLARKEHDLEENGGSYDSNDGRRWRTLGGDGNAVDNNLDPDVAGHVDHKNPHSFEADDLQKLILAATKDLEELDKKRREDFKQYEMEKEVQYRESLQNMTEDQKQETIKKHDESVAKHKDHPKVHHPGSKKQLEQVWEEQDHMPKEEFNPKVFFTMHDINGDGFLDPQEVEALLTLEIKKMYSANNPEDDQNEMMEEYHRMREHIYREADTNRDGLISKKEFLDFTHRMDFERDEGWKGLDEQQVYNDQDLKKYEQHRQQLQQQYGQYGTYQAQYEPQYYPQGYHPQQGYVPHPGQQMHPQEAYHHQQQMQAGHPNQAMHPQQQQQQYQGQQQMHQQLSPEQQQALYHQQQQALHHAQQQAVLNHPQQQQQNLMNQQQYNQQQQLHQQQQQLHLQQQQPPQQINALPPPQQQQPNVPQLPNNNQQQTSNQINQMNQAVPQQQQQQVPQPQFNQQVNQANDVNLNAQKQPNSASHSK